MAWLGEHFTNITGKISDFTKEVILNENSENGLAVGPGVRFPRMLPSIDEATELNHICEEQKIMIEELKKQKDEMECSIVELDEQHQEVVNELLTLKQQLTEENKRLKKELGDRYGQSVCSNINKMSNPFLQYLCSSDPVTPSLDIVHSFDKNISVLIMLEMFRNFRDINAVSQFVLRLKELKLFTESSEEVAEKSYLISTLNSLIKFLNLISLQHLDLEGIAHEIRSVMSEVVSEPTAEYFENRTNSCDTATSITADRNSKDCDTVSVSTETDLTVNNVTDVKVNLSSQYCQTEYLNTSQCCQTEYLLPYDTKLKSDSSSQTELEYSNSYNAIETLDATEKRKICHSTLGESSSVALQTEYVCRCEALEKDLSEMIAEINTLKKENLIKEENLIAEINTLKKENHIKEDRLIAQLECIEEQYKSLEKKYLSTQQILHEKECVIAKQAEDISSIKEVSETLRIQLCELKQKSFNNSENMSIIDGQSFDENGQLTSVSDNDKLLLQKLKALDLEKSRLLYVLNEKSQECSSLKADVHRLTNIVASEKQALFKLQQDNQDLKQGKGIGVDADLAKEALQSLSRLVRDKDLEIESLKEKTNSLSAMVQQSSTGGEQVHSLIEERDQLLKQASKFKAEREKIMSSYNTRDQECRKQIAEIKELKLKLDTSSCQFEEVQNQLTNITHQYEEKQKLLLKARDEVICLKQRVTELENECLNVKTKYSELQNEFNSDSVVTIAKAELEVKTNEIENLKNSLREKDELIHEKDCLIHELSQQVKNLKKNIEQSDLEIGELKKVNDNQLVKLGESESALKAVWEEKESLSQRLSDKQSEVSLLKEMNERLNMTVKEKEFFVQSLEEKISSLSLVIRGSAASPSSPTDIDQILADSKEMYSKAQSFHRERDETLLALSQCQQEKEELKSEVNRLKAVEDHLNSELDRLRKHLLQIEENYTSEALRAETREKELRNELAEVQRTAHLSNSAVLDASYQASVQVASLQEQIAMIAGQRDRALSQLSSLEDKVQQYAASLGNLQLVLEQMQKVHEQKTKELHDKYKAELHKAERRSLELQETIKLKEQQIEESSQALAAASRLSEKIDAKEELIAHLKNELVKAEKKYRSASQEIESFKSNSEGKVDRVVMKSLVLGYFSTPPNQKSEVIRLLARVLDFNQQEMAKAGLIVSRNSSGVEHRGLFATFFGRIPLLSHGQQPPQNSQNTSERDSDDHESFARLFVKFLENESQPTVRMPLPAEEMARELTSKSKSAKSSPKNQLLAATNERGSLLIGMSSTFPTLSPMPQVEHNSPMILKQILQ